MRLRTLVVGLFCVAAPRLIAAQQPALDPTAALLVQLIRANTSNPPGRTAELDSLLASKFRALGFEVQIIPTPDSGKAHFIARLRGDGSKRPILIASHADVVGVERDKWTVEPFAGVVKDGYVYGRGAIDFKGGIAVFARAAMMLAENHVPLARDVIFLSEADEEGAQYSTFWLSQSHWPALEAEFALNEGGWIMKAPDGHVRYVSISTADKSVLNVTVTARGTSTHSSMPRPDNAIFALSRAMARLSTYDPPLMITPETRQFFNTLARTSAPPMSGYYRDLVGSDPAKARRADKIIGRDPLLHALVRNTIAPVIVEGGFRANVIPSSATATVNLRLIPGADTGAVLRELRRVIADPSIEVKAGQGSPTTVPVSSDTTALYRALAREARVTYPTAEVTPYLFQAGTDAGAWRMRGVPVYGIYPYAIDANDLTRMHGNDERVSIASLHQGTEMIYRTLVDVAGKK